MTILNIATTDGITDIAIAEANEGTFVGVRSMELGEMLWTKLTAWLLARMVYESLPLRAAFDGSFMIWRGDEDGPDFDDPVLPSDVDIKWIPSTLCLPRIYHRVTTTRFDEVEALASMRDDLARCSSQSDVSHDVPSMWTGLWLVLGGGVLFGIAVALGV